MNDLARIESRVSCKPFLKWPGGKSKLLPEIHKRLPANYAGYFEPFIGGGALYFSLQTSPAQVSDINEELINVYSVVQQDVESLIKKLDTHYYEKDYYYSIREADRSESFKDWSPVDRAARTIFLNKTCYNGLFRVNSKGEFNTPFGRYKNPKICDADNLRACSDALQGVQFKVSDVQHACETATAGDFVYFDPPYVPVSNTANFVSYASSGFSLEDQRALQNLMHELCERNVQVLLSNSACDFIFDLYKDFTIDVIEAPRAISCQGSGRKAVQEVLVRNYEL